MTSPPLAGPTGRPLRPISPTPSLPAALPPRSDYPAKSQTVEPWTRARYLPPSGCVEPLPYTLLQRTPGCWKCEILQALQLARCGHLPLAPDFTRQVDYGVLNLSGHDGLLGVSFLNQFKPIAFTITSDKQRGITLTNPKIKQLVHIVGLGWEQLAGKHSGVTCPQVTVQ